MSNLRCDIRTDAQVPGVFLNREQKLRMRPSAEVDVIRLTTGVVSIPFGTVLANKAPRRRHRVLLNELLSFHALT